MERFSATLELGGRQFPFTLQERTLVLGPAGPIRYFWMDGSQLRRNPPGPNFRSCVDHWWAAMETIDAADDIDTLAALVQAECYPLVNTARSLQDVYLDAQLSPKVEKEYASVQWGDQAARLAERAFSLPAAETSRLRALAHARDFVAIRAELETLFMGPTPPPAEMPAYAKAAQCWIGNGIVDFRTGGVEALRKRVAEIGKWISMYRKQKGDERVRRFINMFGYSCKVAFYRCMANAWIDLIPWLEAHRGLDPISRRFMQLWHNQNQPGEDDEAGPGGNRDVFCGQVLALHPISAFVMNDPAHLQALGAWIGHPDHDSLIQEGTYGSCPAYWDVVATILIAAHEYKQVREQWDRSRSSQTTVDGQHVGAAVRDESPPPVAVRLEDFATDRGIRCNSCQGVAKYMTHEPPDSETEGTCVTFKCGNCGKQFDETVEADDFAEWLGLGKKSKE